MRLTKKKKIPIAKTIKSTGNKAMPIPKEITPKIIATISKITNKIRDTFYPLQSH